ncbi:hypothetical protein BD289DRAFT_443380 [Coniella lustricola]|uniref:Uncharacterized protein n=1 Tax=Coniella lustricola TaxID=2025994 RepID=A0A2T2ZX72_9PEZI|nr:hypothetical protein BD289DRAFT_443380 [Coniella lustricola]
MLQALQSPAADLLLEWEQMGATSGHLARPPLSILLLSPNVAFAEADQAEICAFSELSGVAPKAMHHFNRLFHNPEIRRRCGVDILTLQWACQFSFQGVTVKGKPNLSCSFVHIRRGNIFSRSSHSLERRLFNRL